MDMFEMLIADHEKVKQLFEEVLEQEEIDKKIVNQICEELLLHMEKEEKCLYPIAKKIEATKELAEEAILEHQEGKVVIQALQSSKLSKTKLKVKVEILQLEIEHHVEEEENELFPVLRKSLSKEQQQEIAQKMQAMKPEKREKSLA